MSDLGLNTMQSVVSRGDFSVDNNTGTDFLKLVSSFGSIKVRGEPGNILKVVNVIARQNLHLEFVEQHSGGVIKAEFGDAHFSNCKLAGNVFIRNNGYFKNVVQQPDCNIKSEFGDVHFKDCHLAGNVTYRNNGIFKNVVQNPNGFIKSEYGDANFINSQVGTVKTRGDAIFDKNSSAVDAKSTFGMANFSRRAPDSSPSTVTSEASASASGPSYRRGSPPPAYSAQDPFAERNRGARPTSLLIPSAASAPQEAPAAVAESQAATIQSANKITAVAFSGSQSALPPHMRGLLGVSNIQVIGDKVLLNDNSRVCGITPTAETLESLLKEVNACGIDIARSDRPQKFYFNGEFVFERPANLPE